MSDLLKEGAQVGLWHGVAHHAVYTGNCALFNYSYSITAQILLFNYNSNSYSIDPQLLVNYSLLFNCYEGLSLR